MTQRPKKISLFLLVLLVVSAIDSIRNLPSSALFGSSLIFFFLLSSMIFLFPVSLVAAELSSLLPEKGGVYHWMSAAFGEKIGMLAIWLQWINTMVWYPTILSFIAGTAAYLLNPGLSENKIYLITIILAVFWGLTIINLFGVKTSAKLNSFCGLVGTMFPMILLIILGCAWVLSGHSAQIHFTFDEMLPNVNNTENWVSLTAIIASFLGMELAGVHVSDIVNPQKNFPKAMAYSALFLIATMLLGSLAIAFVLPAPEINLVAGVMQVFTNFFRVFNIPWATAILTVLILLGSVGGIINWLISPAKGLLHAAEFGFLHPFFIRKNRHGVAQNILFAQAILITIICLVIYIVPSVNAFYWFLTGLSTDLYILMYVLMFASVIKLRKRFPNRPAGFKIPGGTLGVWMVSTLGMTGCALTLFVSFFTPENIHIPPLRYAIYILTGNVALVLPIFFFYRYKKKHPKKTRIDEHTDRPKSSPFGT